MASTTLFAPQVRSVPPAFVYKVTKTDKGEPNIEGSVKIYYSHSEFNINSQYNKIEYKIIDPNRQSGWGSDSMLTEEEFYSNDAFFETKDEEVKKDKIYYIKNDENIYEEQKNLKEFVNGLIYYERFDTIYFNSKEFEEFTLNQYYQIQIRLSNDTEGYKSAWSQASLIRPISAATINIEQQGKMFSLEKIDGWIEYADKSTIEAIKNFCVYIKQGDAEVYRSKVIANTLGTKFSSFLYDVLLPDGNYKLGIEYTTINGFNGKTEDGKENLFQIGYENPIPLDFKQVSLKRNTDIGAVSLEFEFNLASMTMNNEVTFDIQRTSEKDNFSKWLQIKSFNIVNPSSMFRYDDMTIETETVYRYRILVSYGGKVYIADKDLEGKFLEVLTRIEDIHLMGEHQQLSIKYNPNISGFKYVTQESITNSLGGKFPIVRINGDTKYRQFSLSGTLSFNTDYIALNAEGVDSRGVDMRRWWKEENCTLLFDLESLIANFSGAAEKMVKNSTSYLEKKYRSLAMDFLTDQKPKLFRGMAEDTMIVYLSNVSFTPNKQLSREVWDFSCTVTEICEYNKENLIRYNLFKSNTIYSLEYLLKMKKNSSGQEYIPLEETVNNIPILHAFWKETDFKGFDSNDLSVSRK